MDSPIDREAASAAARNAPVAANPDLAPASAPMAMAAAAVSAESEDIANRRDRLLASLTLIAGVGLVVALPFALRAGAEFFLPVTAALIIAVALVPILEWLERRRLPAPVASLVCVIGFLMVANGVLAAIVVPAFQFFRMLPERIGRIQMNIKPILEIYNSVEKYVDKTAMRLAAGSAKNVADAAQATAVPPRSLIELVAVSAPTVLLHIFFGTLIVFFFLSGWTRLRRQTITSRASFDGALATARVIQNVVDDTSAYLGTITVINLALGLAIAIALWVMGMPYPLMWGGIVALLNYVPYLGPIAAAMLLALGGLMVFSDLWVALVPALIMIGAHLLEANVITPLVVGHRLTINPIMILISLSFWGWVWGTPGALLAVPILIILQTVIEAAGKPDIAGFLFEHGTLDHGRRGGGGAAPPGR